MYFDSSNHSSNNDDLDYEGLSKAIPTGNSRIQFHYYVKGTLGKKNKSLYLELETSTIIFSDGTSLPIKNILNTSKTSHTPGGLVLSIDTENSKLQEKKWYFQSENESSLFQMYLAALNNSGEILFRVFKSMDTKQVNQLTWRELRKTALKYGIDIHPDECKDMISLVDRNHNDYLDYVEFFQFFMNYSITNVESCILEWQNQYVEDITRAQPRSSRVSILESTHQLSSNYFTVDIQPSLVPGEKMLNIIQHVRYTLTPSILRSPKPNYVGNLYFTNYRLIFSSYRRTCVSSQALTSTKGVLPRPFEDIILPLSCINKIELLKPKDPIYTIGITCKDLRIIRIAFEAKENFAVTFEGFLSSQVFPSSVKKVFAYLYSEDFNNDQLHSNINLNSHTGWNLYSPRKEFSRQEVLQTDYFRIYSDEFLLVDTYPRQFLVPSGIPDTQLIEAAKFRSKNRLPALTFRNKRNGAVLCRSSQPMVGVLGHRSLADKLLLNLYRVRGNIHDQNEIENPSDFYIMDCRKAIAATANSALGKGVEDEKQYDRTKVIFLEIDNIHVMRTCLQLLEQVLLQGVYVGTDSSHDDSRFYAKIEETEWLVHIRKILIAGVLVAEKLELERASVLVHCSDGWDRTAQVCALAQILLDPYFRTIEGLCVLIEKDWCSFGHKFHDRIGHADSNTESSERSPVMLQWLDVVHQIILQFPNQFQYTEKLLIFIADAVYSCLFGTFLGNSEKDREKDLNCKSRTKSIWSYVMFHATSWTNPNYEEYAGPIWPATTSRNIKLWERYFFRWEPEMHPRISSGIEWLDDWGTKIIAPIQQTNHIQPNMKPIEINQHDNSSDSNISRPISVSHGRLPVDLNLNDSTQTRGRTSSDLFKHIPSTIDENDENDDKEDILKHRTSRLQSL